MKQALFTGNGQVDIVEVPDPVPGRGQIVLQVHACGICGSDKDGFLRGHPMVMGHEVSGVVTAVGPDSRLAPGTRVVGYIAGHCGECQYCRSGRTNMCRNLTGVYGFDYPGGYAEYMVLPEQNAIPIDPRIGPDEAVILLDVLGTTCHGLRQIGVEKGQSVLIIGCGPIGLGTLAALRAFGVERIHAAEKHVLRLRAASRLGAAVIDLNQTSLEEYVAHEMPGGFDVVVEATGEHDPIAQSLHAVAPFGKVLIFGEFWGRISIEPTLDLVHKNFSVHRSWYFPLNEFAANQELVLAGRVDPHLLLDRAYPLAEIRAGLMDFIKGRTLKALIKPFARG